jgi:Family of unknown function (DUF6152)
VNGKLFRGLSLAILLLIMGVPLSAHHGRAPYDMATTTSIKGTITGFDWMNPHSIIYIDVKSEQGGVEKWLIETEPPTTLNRCGWSSNGQKSGLFVKPGDDVTLVGHRAKNGKTIMVLSKIILANGKELDALCRR